MRDFFAGERTRHDLGWNHLLEALAARTSTARGRERALDLPFLPTRADIEQSLGRIEEIRSLVRARQAIPLAGVEDVRVALARAAKQAVLSPYEILACGRMIAAAAQARSFVMGRRDALPLCARLAQSLPEGNVLAQDIEAAIEPSGTLRDNASPTLAELRQRARRLHHEIKARIDGLLQDSQFAANLQDTYFSVRGDRYVLPVHASFQSKVPGIVHNASHSGQTVFVEPQQLVPLGNELAIAESLAVEEEQRILALFSAELGEDKDTWLAALERLADLDIVQASATLAEEWEASVPALGEANGTLQLRHLRHPRLLLQGKAVVRNHVALQASQSALVISGPNAGGKTATLTGVGLCALLVRAGLPIPADGSSVMPLFSGICCAIGDAQDLSRGLSTFSAHLEQLRDITDVARGGWLVLIDEIAADTDPHEGAALARATLEELVEHGAQVLVSTHLEEIKALGVTDARFVNARVGFDVDSLRPTYRLETGAAGASNALAVAAQMGLSPRVLERARAHLQDSGLLAAALSRLNDAETQLARDRAGIAAQQQALASKEEQLAAAQMQAEEARREARRHVFEELASELAASRQQVSALIADLQAKPDMRRAQQVQRHLDQQAPTARQRGAAPAAAPPTAAPTAVLRGKLRPGQWVRVLSLNQEGEILQMSADSALVALGAMRARFKFEDLEPTTRAAPANSAAAKMRRHFPGAARVAPEAVAATASIGGPAGRCDLRGMRADEALRQLERDLDENFGAGSATLIVVHGLGTGALRDAVREALSRSPYVADFRTGDRHEGGEGVTVVRLGS